jgi:hypothetical protein
MLNQIIKAVLIAYIFLIGGIAGYNLALLGFGLRSFDDEFEDEAEDD